MLADILYLEKNNRSTNIKYPNFEEVINEPILKIIDNVCLLYLTTLKGRSDAIKQTYKIYKNIPIYISNEVILQPLFDSRNWKQIYINVSNVKEYYKSENGTMIKFYGGKTIEVEISIKKLNQYLEKCLKIKTDQFDKYERGNILWQRKISEILN